MANSSTTYQHKGAHWAQMVLLAPSVVVLALFLLHWASPTGDVPAWGRMFFMFSPILLIYSLCILFVFVRRRVSLWLKLIEIAIIVSALFPLVGISWFVIRMLCGVDVLPVPAD